MKKVLTILVAVPALLVIISIFYLGISPTTPPFKDDEGKVIPASIANLEAVELGNLKQWISIRGIDQSNPVILWLHGGPGAAQMSLSHYLDKELEKEFVVVHWDQRGAGKSNHAGFDEQTMTFEQFKSDARELVEYLRETLQREKIYLLGHSWGTQLGTELVHEHPEYFYAYISVSQVVDSASDIAYHWLVEEMEKQEDQAGLKKLEQLGKPPYRHEDYSPFARLVDSYGGSFDKGIWRLALIAFGADEYSIMDYYRMLKGMQRGGGPMHPEGEMLQYNFPEEIPALEVPTFFLAGKNDYNTPLALIEKYYEVLDAPHKELIVFENSAHTPFLAETDKFYREVIEIKKKVESFE